MKRAILAAIVCLMLVGSVAQADIVIYQQNFNSYGNGTLLSAVPGWYDWSAAQIPVIQGGKAVLATAGAKCDMLLNMTDVFGYGNTQARIEFDMVGGWENDVFFAPGAASALDFNYSEFMGWEQGPYNGANLLFTSAAGNGYVQATQNWTSLSVLPERHYVIDVNKTGTLITWSGTFDGNNIMGGGYTSLSYTLTDVRGLNTMEWFGSWQSDYPAQPPAPNAAQCSLDNVVITALGVGGAVPEPAGLGLIGLALLAVRKRRS